MAWNLYFLAQNPEVQEKLRAEIRSAVGTAEIVTPAHLQNMSYLKNCIKEALRLSPVLPNCRVLNRNTILAGYKIPSGTTVMCNEAVTGRLPELFDEPECYRPERWDRKNKEPPHAFASLPFGYGPRMCLGRRLVELEMQIALVHIIRVFQLTYHGEELGMKQTTECA